MPRGLFLGRKTLIGGDLKLCGKTHKITVPFTIGREFWFGYELSRKSSREINFAINIVLCHTRGV